jgi:excinuclease ABC subunit B
MTTTAIEQKFQIVSEFEPKGGQPEAILQLTDGIASGLKHQSLLGITGSGKTFTIANVIQNLQRPTLVISHNKTLTAQLCNEFREFFPNNAVHYFVSYYDYYQPEAYIPQSDTYIEKDSSINEEIDRLRHAATSSLFERRDVIIVASVSCIYGLGRPKDYIDMTLHLQVGETKNRDEILRQLVNLQYTRNDIGFSRSTFRVRGDTIELIPSYNENVIRIELFGDEIDSITELDPITGKKIQAIETIRIYPSSHYVTPEEKLKVAQGSIREELKNRLEWYEKHGKLLEAQRIEQRTNYDLEMMSELGYCSGIENYSRHLAGREPGSRPFTLLDYFPDDLLIVIDESHQTVPQLNAMYNGDQARKKVLIEHGFRLPSAADNRPLKFEEYSSLVKQCIYMSATPGPYEREISQRHVEQIVRPTGLLDPEVIVRPIKGQIDDLVDEIRETTTSGGRILVTTLTKKMSENLTDYLIEAGIRARYLHSEINTLDRMDIIHDLRAGEFDVLVGINLLREGLDLPEVVLVAILDADKEGFLRSETSLIQTIGRAARNVDGRVILYADVITGSMKVAMEETERRSEIQRIYNEEHGITPATIRKDIKTFMPELERKKPGQKKKKGAPERKIQNLSDKELAKLIKNLESEMFEAAKKLEFEKAAKLRDELKTLRRDLIGVKA